MKRISKKGALVPIAPGAIEPAGPRFGTVEVVPLTVYYVPELHPKIPGPWRLEADKIAWTDPATGLSCIIRRSGYGHLCGFVGVEAHHPLYGFAAGALPQEPALRVHGRIVHAGACDSRLPVSRSVWRKPPHPDAPPAWWFGFECHHSFDIVPSRLRDTAGHGSGRPSLRGTSGAAGGRSREDYGSSCENDGCGCPGTRRRVYDPAAGTVFTGVECGPIYRDEAYVYRCCVDLAAQLDAIAMGLPLPSGPSMPPLGLDPLVVGGRR